MRTRFLNIDYFNPSSSKTLENFLHLPLPHLTPQSSLSDSEQHLLSFCFDSAPLRLIPVDIDLPIGDALSKFYDDVLPQIIDVQIGEFSDDSCEIQSLQEGVGENNDDSELLKKENERIVDGNNGSEVEMVQFEEPHLDLFLIDDSFSEQEGTHLLSEVPEAKFNLDMLISELQMQYPDEVKKSIYSLEKVASDYHMDQEAYRLEHPSSVQDSNPFSNFKFPLLEVGEISLGFPLDRSLVDEFNLLLESIEFQHCTEKDLMVDENKLLGSVDITLVENFPDSCLKQCLKSEMICLNMFLEKDYVSIMENFNGEGNSALHEGTSDGECFVHVSSILYEEIQVLDVDSSQPCGIFSDHLTIGKPVTFDPLMEDMNLKSFDDLIVSHELALADDTFKSLPVPIFSDPESIKSMYQIVEEILEDMKPLPLSTTDGIYLDWNLLEGDKCKYTNMLDDMVNYSIDFDLNSTDEKKFILDYVFCGDLNKPVMGESRESLNMLPGDIYIFDEDFAGVDSIKVESRCQKPGNGELLVNNGRERVSMLVESMTQFNDLDFFLNPRKATPVGNSESVDKTFNTKDSHPMVRSFVSTADKVELEDCSTPNFYGDGGSIFHNDRVMMDGQAHCVRVDKNMKGQKLKELSYTKPMKHKIDSVSLDAADSLETCSMPLQVPFAPLDLDSKQTQSSMSSFPDKVIIVNTQNFEKEMIISRRSTYQKILSMEKEGAQVVERDSDLPVDVIISAALCLVWYDSKNISKKSTPKDEASSSLPLCVENIATNVLTMLSFAFSGCILVFEGDMRFIAEIMESSDGLYAAAASLGIDLKLFYSYSSELTDEIILNSIELATQSTRGLYPAMPESETLAESFLTKFPSINPLSAHAVLSSVSTLVNFFEWSNERRIRETKKYLVPEESVTLFTALCRYGEHEGSKSGMTDCSSSVSSPPDSEYFYKTRAKRMRQNTINSPKDFDIPIETVLHFEPLDPSRVLKQNDSGMSIGPDVLSERKKLDSSWNGKKSGQKQTLDRAMAHNLNWDEISTSDVLHEDLLGEVIGFKDSSLFDADFSSVLNSEMHSTFVKPMKNDTAARNFKTARRLSFANSTGPPFSPAAEINHETDIWNSVEGPKQNPNQDVDRYFETDFKYDNMHKEFFGQGSTQKEPRSFNEIPFHEKEVPHYHSDIWNSIKDQKQNLTHDNIGHFEKEFHIDHMPLRHRRELSGEGSKQNPAQTYNEFPSSDKYASQYAETPLKKAIGSSQLQQGSPWTIEFLNKIREKSRLRQQTLPCNMSSPGFGLSGNISKVNKRKSLSILDFYKYKGGSVPKKAEQKRQKRYTEPSKKDKNSAPFLPTWTPSDKRARQQMEVETKVSLYGVMGMPGMLKEDSKIMHDMEKLGMDFLNVGNTLLPLIHIETGKDVNSKYSHIKALMGSKLSTLFSNLNSIPTFLNVDVH